MRNRLTSARGLSLVEVTIMLLVLMTLTGVLAPSIMDFVHDAQWVKAKEDCEAIGVSVGRLMRDVGPCLKFNGAGPCTKANRADLLYSDGPDVTADDVSGDAAFGFDGGSNTASALNWHTDSARGDSMAHQFVDNGGGPGYPAPSDLGTDGGPAQARASAGAGPTCRPQSAPTRGVTGISSTACSSPSPATQRRARVKDSEAAGGRTTRSAFRPARTASTNALRRQRHARRALAGATT